MNDNLCFRHMTQIYKRLFYRVLCIGSDGYPSEFTSVCEVHVALRLLILCLVDNDPFGYCLLIHLQHLITLWISSNYCYIWGSNVICCCRGFLLYSCKCVSVDLYYVFFYWYSRTLCKGKSVWFTLTHIWIREQNIAEYQIIFLADFRVK